MMNNELISIYKQKFINIQEFEKTWQLISNNGHCWGNQSIIFVEGFLVESDRISFCWFLPKSMSESSLRYFKKNPFYISSFDNFIHGVFITDDNYGLYEDYIEENTEQNVIRYLQMTSYFNPYNPYNDGNNGSIHLKISAYYKDFGTNIVVLNFIKQARIFLKNMYKHFVYNEHIQENEIQNINSYNEVKKEEKVHRININNSWYKRSIARMNFVNKDVLIGFLLIEKSKESDLTIKNDIENEIQRLEQDEEHWRQVKQGITFKNS